MSNMLESLVSARLAQASDPNRKSEAAIVTEVIDEMKVASNSVRAETVMGIMRMQQDVLDGAHSDRMSKGLSILDEIMQSCVR